MAPAAHYHVGIVVPDLTAARRQLTELLDIAWGPVIHLDTVEYRSGDGADIELPTTICYSTGSPSIELIQERPGTVWECNAHSNLHHLGFWTDDLGATSAALGAGGCPMQISGRIGSDAPEAFAYHRHDELGVRIELVDAAMRDAMSVLFQPEPTE